MKILNAKAIGLVGLGCVYAVTCGQWVRAASLSIPVAGNSWVTNDEGMRSRIITRRGMGNWDQARSNIRTFFRVEQTGDLEVALRARVESGTSELKVACADQIKQINASNCSKRARTCMRASLAERGLAARAIADTCGRPGPPMDSY